MQDVFAASWFNSGRRVLEFVNQLMQAMASPSQQTGLTWDEAIGQRPQNVQTVLAASWH